MQCPVSACFLPLYTYDLYADMQFEACEEKSTNLPFLKLFITNIEICGWVFSFECSWPDSQTPIWRRIYWGMHAWRLNKTLWIHNLQ
jgi:hypothetical protein